MKNSPKPRVVLDTNVLISALVFGGKPRQIIELFAEEEIEVAISSEILSELRRKVTTKFPAEAKALESYEALFEEDGEVVKLGGQTVNASQDPDDNKFIETALIGDCDYIISGDKHLLELKSYKGIKIIKPAAFLKRIGR